MKTIPLSRGRVAVVDDPDFDALSAFKWCVTAAGYAVRMRRKSEPDAGRMVYMHREIFPGPAEQVDHINGDKLDNRRANLRACTNAQNCCNTARRRDNASGVKGVCWHARGKKWMAHIVVNGRQHYLGLFANLEDAKAVRTRAALEYQGEFAQEAR